MNSDSWKLATTYGVPVIGLKGPAFLVASYFLSFGTDVLLLAPAAVASLVAAARLWDAVSDPAVGVLSDRTRTRLGRRRSWMLVSGPLAALAFVAVWMPPTHLTEPALLVWCGAALLAFTTASTGWAIPHSALGAELTPDAALRTRLFGLRYVCAVLGAAASFGVMQWIITAEQPRDTAAALGLWIGIAMLVLLAIPPLALREPDVAPDAERERPSRALWAVLRNADARRLYFVWFADQMAIASQGAIAPYMTIYVLKRPDMIGLIPAYFIGPMVLAVPAWTRIAKRLGTKRAWLLSMFGASASYASLFWLGSENVWLAPPLLAAAGFCTGCGGPLGPTLLAGVIDADARKCGVRREGLFFAGWTFVDKASGAAIVLAIGFALQFSGFVANEPLTPASDFAIRACLALLPAAMFVLGAVALRGVREDAAAQSGA